MQDLKILINFDMILYDQSGKDTIVHISLKRTLLGKQIMIRLLIELSKLKPKDKLKALRTRVTSQNQDNVNIELERIKRCIGKKDVNNFSLSIAYCFSPNVPIA
jgi:hypothetical protein